MATITKVPRFNTILDEEARRLYAPVISTLFALMPEMMQRKFPAANVQQGFMLAAILELSSAFPKSKTLCVGCHEDTAYESLLKMGVRADGIDPNANGVDLDKFLALHPDRKGTYDIVFSTSVLEHVNKDEDFVAGIDSLLAPGGYGIFTCDFKNAWKVGERVPWSDIRFYRSSDLSDRLLRAMPHCQLVDTPDWDAFQPDFRFDNCLYNFATFTVQRNSN